jgi:protease PrsW
MELITIFFIAFIPALIYVVTIYWLDRYEKEPKILIGIVFVWGALIAAGAAYILNTIFGLSVYFLIAQQIFCKFSQVYHS